MTLQEAIEARHSVRAYKDQPLTEEVVNALNEKIAELNRVGNLHIQLIQNEPKAFQGKLAKYGKFSGVRNYLVMAGKKGDDLNERVGYYGEQLVLFGSDAGIEHLLGRTQLLKSARNLRSRRRREDSLLYRARLW